MARWRTGFDIGYNDITDRIYIMRKVYRLTPYTMEERVTPRERQFHMNLTSSLRHKSQS